MTRHFDYSSLKRLIHAQNPETGDIYYDYDYNGNLTRRRHGSLTACTGTPGVTYQYDLTITAQQPATCQGTNPVTNAAWDTGGAVGRRSSVSNSVSTTYYFYNELGQAQCSRQQVGIAHYDFAYTTTPQRDRRNEVYPWAMEDYVLVWAK